MEKYLRIIPLGGLEEIGLNSTLLETESDAILFDAGLMFPEEDMLGVDLVIPDFTYIYENVNKLKGIFITHAHEDHVGALPYLMKDVSVPIYGTKLTLGLVGNKLREFHVDTEMVEIEPRMKYKVGCFTIEPLRTTHSIVDGVGFAIETYFGTIIHTGDFKIDHTPVDGRPFDLLKFAEYGKKGVKLLMSDSTNAMVPGFTRSESEVGDILAEIFSKARGRIILVTFASNIHRIQQVINVAQKCSRRVCITGKSMVQNATIAKELGYLDIPQRILVPENQINNYPDKGLVIVTTGSQGEPLSGLSRIALDEHKHIRVKPTDTVVISAKTIPGNERAVKKIVNILMEKDVDVFFEDNSDIHVSGHGAEEELKLMISITCPQYFMPIHGEFMMRKRHAEIAEQLGMSRRNIFLVNNGDVIEFVGKRASVGPQIKAGKVFIDGKGVGDVEDDVLRDRKKLSEGGFVVVIVVLDSKRGELNSEPEIITKGLLYEEKSQRLLKEAVSMVKNLIKQSDAELRRDEFEMKKRIRKAMNKFLYKKLMRNPMVIPIVIMV